MRQVVIASTGKVSVVDAPDPDSPGDLDAVVRVTASAICGSDLHFYDGDIPVGEPMPIGHEAVGIVEAVGAGVRRFQPGMRVLVASVAGCGACEGCATLDPVTCLSGPTVFGAGSLGGAQAQMLSVPAADFQLLEAPDWLDDEAALLLTDNLVTAWAGAKRADVPEGGTVLVLGLGAVGLLAVRSALAQGAGQVFAYDPVPGRRFLAEASGAISVEDPSELVKRTGGRGVHGVIDAVALDASLDAALAAVRAGGTVSVIGVHNLEPYPFPLLLALFRSITLRGTVAPVQQAWPELLSALEQGRISTEGIFTHRMSLEDATLAYALAAERSGDVLKILLEV